MPIEFDNTQAHREGWFISECDGSIYGPWQIQKDDEAAVFEDDAQVWRLIKDRAAAGSAYHAGALAFIETHNPIEFALVVNGIQPT